MKTILLVCVSTIGLLVFAELGLRLVLGLGNPLRYVADAEIGYLLVPNQKVRRLGKKIAINQYSMRSPAISPTPSQDTLRLMLLGDSVANGAWWTDQQQIISELMKRQLQLVLPDSSVWQQVEVLNASANSWGPRNQLAYVQRFGTFQGQVLVLLINTDDLFATAPTSIVVGKSIYYPDRKPPLALVELYNRYVVGEKPIPGLQEINSAGGDRVGDNLQAIKKIKDITNQNNAQLLLAMTPLLRELGEPGSRDYELIARKRLEEFARSEQIPYTDFLPLFNATEQPEALYRDHIHLSPQGNQLVSNTLSQAVLSVVSPAKQPIINN